MKFCCDQIKGFSNDERFSLIYIPKFREFGLLNKTGGSSFQEIYYCPWCGSKLPTSLRSEWFEKLDELGLEPDSENLPKEMHSDSWWEAKNL